MYYIEENDRLFTILDQKGEVMAYALKKDFANQLLYALNRAAILKKSTKHIKLSIAIENYPGEEHDTQL
ncbi:hypothetical protein GCM10023231_31990 [Olivibacter ginsenosidimutans]|uniref:Uncharacterized protein n=1 Tax=Olivibacter ginsenosidimutans TaxID=1176537 RepID=A0ABP9BUW9_9SPHI